MYVIALAIKNPFDKVDTNMLIELSISANAHDMARVVHNVFDVVSNAKPFLEMCIDYGLRCETRRVISQKKGEGVSHNVWCSRAQFALKVEASRRGIVAANDAAGGAS